MFNHLLFDGIHGVSVYEQFLKDGKNCLALVMDPPFGGKVEVISQTLQTIDADYKRINGNTALDISSKLLIHAVIVHVLIHIFGIQNFGYFLILWNPKSSFIYLILPC